MSKPEFTIICPRCQSALKKLPERTPFDNLMEFICENCGFRHYRTRGRTVADARPAAAIPDNK